MFVDRSLAFSACSFTRAVLPAVCDLSLLPSHAAHRLTGLRRPRSLDWNMKPQGPAKHFIVAFLLALVGYIFFYQTIEHQRTRKGPWQVSFTQGTAGAPTLIIVQPKLAITNVQISFPGETLPVTNSQPTITTLFFAQPRPVPYDVPFGKCVFIDTTFLPGTITFDLFGHEIELLPRALIIDCEEHRWQPNATIPLPHAARTTPHAKP